jgi:hypothetical protein
MEKYLDDRVERLGHLPAQEKMMVKGCHQVLSEKPWEAKGILRVGLIRANDAKKIAVPDCLDGQGRVRDGGAEGTCEECARIEASQSNGLEGAQGRSYETKTGGGGQGSDMARAKDWEQNRGLQKRKSG